MGQQMATVSVTDFSDLYHRRRSRRLSVAYQFKGSFRKLSYIMRKDRPKELIDIEDLKRFRPGSLHELTAKTKFTEAELKQLYRGFKENCTTGCVSVEKFTEIFERYFGYGDVKAYAKLVFTSFDTNCDNVITFEEFVCALSTLLRGTNKEKLDWIFDLYDRHDKGYIDRADVEYVLRAIYALYNRADALVLANEQEETAQAVQLHANHMFSRLDRNNDGEISRDEFVSASLADENIVTSFDSLAFFWPRATHPLRR